jgi:hypothetical protein
MAYKKKGHKQKKIKNEKTERKYRIIRRGNKYNENRATCKRVTNKKNCQDDIKQRSMVQRQIPEN